MRKQRRDRVLNFRAQLARITSSAGQRRFAIFQEKVIEIRISMNKRQLACVGVEGKLVALSAELHRRSNESRHFRIRSRSMMGDPEVLRYEVLSCQHAANSQNTKHAELNLMSV